jgi:hypothetical protein
MIQGSLDQRALLQSRGHHCGGSALRLQRWLLAGRQNAVTTETFIGDSPYGK